MKRDGFTKFRISFYNCHRYSSTEGKYVLLIIISPCIFFFADITIPPSPVNVSVNSVADFTCNGVANGLTWEANKKQLDNSEGVFIQTVLVQNILISTLRIPVSSTDNATNITCTAISLHPLAKDQSDPVLMMVQGKIYIYRQL